MRAFHYNYKVLVTAQTRFHKGGSIKSWSLTRVGARRGSTESHLLASTRTRYRRGTSANDSKAVENVTLFLSSNFVSLVIVMLLKAWAEIHRLGF